MKTILMGFCGWARMGASQNESLKVTDTAITVVVTLLVATTWAMLR